MFSFVSHLRIFKLAHFKSFINKYRRLVCLNSSENFLSKLTKYKITKPVNLRCLMCQLFKLKYVVFKHYRCIICGLFRCISAIFSKITSLFGIVYTISVQIYTYMPNYTHSDTSARFHVTIDRHQRVYEFQNTQATAIRHHCMGQIKWGHLMTQGNWPF